MPGNLGAIGTFGHYNILNLTLATEVLLGNRSALRPAVVLPLRDGDDKSFDYELTVQWNWFF